jgi:hypothetical protein
MYITVWSTGYSSYSYAGSDSAGSDLDLMSDHVELLPTANLLARSMMIAKC